VGLRVHHDFRVADPGGSRPRQVRPGHVGEIIRGPEYGHIAVVQVQERLQVDEVIVPAQLFDISIRQLDAVAFGEPEDQLRLQRSLDVDVEFHGR
jgi:hypothetical protein